MSTHDKARLNDDNLDTIAEQVSKLTCALTPEELDEVFSRAQRIVRTLRRQAEQQQAEGSARQDEERFNRMMEE